MEQVWQWITTDMWPDIIISLKVSFVGLSLVYFFGRMEGWVNSYRGRNSIFAISSIIYTWIYVYLFIDNPPSILEWIWVISYYTALANIIYTTVYMRLYIRLDKVQDKKIAED